MNPLKKKPIVIAVIAIIVTVGFYLFRFHNGLSFSQDHWGQFGDWFGGILNPFIALMALYGLLLAYDAQITANKLASDQFKEQNTDDRIFRMLDLYKNKVDSMSAEGATSQQLTGRNAVKEILFHFRRADYQALVEIAKNDLKQSRINPNYDQYQLDLVNAYVNQNQDNPYGLKRTKSGQAYAKMMADVHKKDEAIDVVFVNTVRTGTFQKDLINVQAASWPDDTVLSHIKIIHSEIYSIYGNETGHYFRNMAQILKYLRKLKITQREFFGKLFRAQLSRYEIALLSYNCLSNMTDKEFNENVMGFDLLKDAFDRDFIHSSRFENLLKLRNTELGVSIKVGEYYNAKPEDNPPP